MSSPYQYPWVGFQLEINSAIDSTEQIIFGKETASIVDTILVCNTTNQEIFVNMWILAERNSLPVTGYLCTKTPIAANQSLEILHKPKNFQSGDILYAQSDYTGNTFDCFISYRQLLETA